MMLVLVMMGVAMVLVVAVLVMVVLMQLCGSVVLRLHSDALALQRICSSVVVYVLQCSVVLVWLM